MSTTTAALRGRIDASPTTLGLAAGDLLLIGTFALLGVVSHGGRDFALSNPGYVLATALPFLVGWLLVAPAVGLYGVRESSRTAAVYTVIAWSGAAVVGQALRATALFHGDFAVTFFFVSLGVGFALLVPWRVAVSVVGSS
ncbi:DUF3054 domain-containing protein [Halomarina halobia]|uniref:DUF3054 domain-containing protein n=1 Tax=Halomarina halobia TaxID=3033386 RepID=A0ABD6A7L4_9EURY|nr:DUF3054 domain-containing protein [Halomarina sp. PSR21]